jgi:hypothetical protein
MNPSPTIVVKFTFGIVQRADFGQKRKIAMIRIRIAKSLIFPAHWLLVPYRLTKWNNFVMTEIHQVITNFTGLSLSCFLRKGTKTLAWVTKNFRVGQWHLFYFYLHPFYMVHVLRWHLQKISVFGKSQCLAKFFLWEIWVDYVQNVCIK